MPFRRIDANKKALFLRPEALDRSVLLLLLAVREFEATTRAALQEGLTATHRVVLLLLRVGLARNAVDLQELLSLPKQTVSRHVRQLIDEGLVVQEAADDDRRRRRLVLTTAGAEVTAGVDRAQRRRLGAIFKSHGPEVVASFESVLLDLVGSRARPHFDSSEAAS